MLHIGIDPGISGGIAAVARDGSRWESVKMPATERDLLDVFARLSRDAKRLASGVVPCRAIIERVHSSPQMGVASAFTFGRGYGALRMALTAARIPFDEVTPQKWQKAMGCLSGGDKAVTKRRAQQLFPHVTVTHAIADALLIAEFCRRTHGRGEAQTAPRSSLVHGASDVPQRSILGEP